jgi:hypothetical protein
VTFAMLVAAFSTFCVAFCRPDSPIPIASIML